MAVSFDGTESVVAVKGVNVHRGLPALAALNKPNAMILLDN